MAFVGPWEIALILIVVLILFGPKKLPELAKSVGDAMRQYRKATESPLVDEPKPRESSSGTEGKTLIETAKKMGVKTEGKTAEEISEEIVTKSKPARRSKKIVTAKK